MQTNGRLPGVKFLPFVGEHYHNSRYGVRVLVLGESHYGATEDSGPDFTQKVVQDCAYVPGEPFFSKLTNVLRGRIDWPTDEERHETWQHVAFYNFIQEFVGGQSRIAPTPAMWQAAQAPFLEVVRTLEPDVILVLGSRLWNNVDELPPTYPVEWCSITHPSGAMSYEPSIAALAESLRKVGGSLKWETQSFTMILDRTIYTRAAREQLDFEALLTNAIEAELKRIEAERPTFNQKGFDAIMERHGDTIRALADR